MSESIPPRSFSHEALDEAEEEQDDELSEVFPDIPRRYRIGTGPKGRGLFATHDIPPRTLLHVAPCLKIERPEYQDYMKHTILEHYLFNTSSGCKMLALGDGSLFNHSRQPSVDYRVDGKDEVIRYSSGHAPIQKGEELCIYYGANLWFDDADGEKEEESSDEDEAFLGRLNLE
jgi:SET domain-containing protein